MIIWNSKLYMDAWIARHPKRYRRILDHKKLTVPVFCVTLPINGDNSMEIYSSNELWWEYRREQSVEVVGLARTRESAVRLVEQMTQDLYRKEGTISASLFHQYFS